ncbi:MAG: hypothetical protein ACRDKS_11405, partial [Actinomycetota bacterium]
QHRVVEIAAGDTVEIPVYVAVPADASAGTSGLSFTAASENAGDVSVQGEASVKVVGSAVLGHKDEKPRPTTPGGELPGTGVDTRWFAGACALALAALLNRARRRPGLSPASSRPRR